MKFLFYIPLLIAGTAFAQKIPCTQYHEGTFKVTDPKSKKVCIITRKGDVQTERMEESDETYDFNLVWLDDCTYTLTPTPATAARRKETLTPGTMTVRIIKTAEAGYTSRITVANNPKFRRLDEVSLVTKE